LKCALQKTSTGASVSDFAQIQIQTIVLCTSIVEKTLNHYYKGGEGKACPEDKSGQANASKLNPRGDSSSPERTGNTKQRHIAGVTANLNASGESRKKRSLEKGGHKDERKATSLLLQSAKRTPYEFCKLSFVITLPFEMQIEQI